MIIRDVDSKVMTVQDIILLENLIDRYGSEMVLNEMKLSTETICALFLCGYMSLSAVGCVVQNAKMKRYARQLEKETIEKVKDPNSDMTPEQGRKIIKKIHERTAEFEKEQARMQQQQNKKTTNRYGIPDADYQDILKKSECVKKEIARVLEKKGKTLKDINFNPEYMVYSCYKNNYDLPLLVAQARYESNFGTEGVAKKTNSIFGVGAYDYELDHITYTDQNKSIGSYIRLMQNDYMQNGKKSVHDLLRPGKFVNMNGDRYSTNMEYEETLKNIRDSLMKMYPELAKPFVRVR